MVRAIGNPLHGCSNPSVPPSIGHSKTRVGALLALQRRSNAGSRSRRFWAEGRCRSRPPPESPDNLEKSLRRKWEICKWFSLIKIYYNFPFCLFKKFSPQKPHFKSSITFGLISSHNHDLWSDAEFRIRTGKHLVKGHALWGWNEKWDKLRVGEKSIGQPLRGFLFKGSKLAWECEKLRASRQSYFAGHHSDNTPLPTSASSKEMTIRNRSQNWKTKKWRSSDVLEAGKKV